MTTRTAARVTRTAIAWALVAALLAVSAHAQVAPSREEIQAYTGLFAAAARGDAKQITALIAAGARPDVRDTHGRTPLHAATFGRHADAMSALVTGGADPNALENDRYDIVTIAAVANDLEMLKIAIEGGGNARNITSRYDGTALIAAAHLGHAEAVKLLITARAPLNHVNNLGWTALIEAIVLGDGGARHQATVEVLIKGGANLNLADGNGRSPLALARQKGYAPIAQMLEQAGAKP
jgi:ankyrin repeat protein